MRSLIAYRAALLSLIIRSFHWNDACHCVTSPQSRMKFQCYRFDLGFSLILVCEVAVDRTSRRHFQRIVYGKAKRERSKNPIARIV